MRSRLTRIGIVLAALVLMAGGGAAWATSGDDDESVTGPAADRAKAAALAHMKGGTAVAVERESEGRAVWEVEVRRADGSTVEVLLDANYELVSSEGDSDESEDEGAENDDD